jgi:hypothetical protein
VKKTVVTTTAFFLVFVLLPAAASPSAQGTRTLQTRGQVSGLSADGRRVAVLTTDIKGSCDRIVVWNPAARRTTRINSEVGCPNFDGSIDVLTEFALANTRVAWIEGSGGNSLELSLRSRVLGSKEKTKTLAFASNGNGAAEDSTGDYIGNIFGDGGTLAYNSWNVCEAIPVGWEGGQTCPDPAPGDTPISIYRQQRLLKVVNGKGVAIASAPDVTASGLRTMSLRIIGVDSRRIATQRPDGSVAIYSAGVSTWKRIAVPTGTFSGFAFQGSQLATIRNDDLELYDVNSGALVKTIPLAAGSKLRDLQNGLAVYLHGRKVHVLRLADGTDIRYTASGAGPIDAQIERSGLFYSHNYQNANLPGRVVFVPFAAVLKKLG